MIERRRLPACSASTLNPYNEAQRALQGKCSAEAGFWVLGSGCLGFGFRVGMFPHILPVQYRDYTRGGPIIPIKDCLY